jgi:hypothetical protein
VPAESAGPIRIAAHTMRPSGFRNTPNRTIATMMSVIGRRTNRGTGGPLVTSDLAKIASPMSARIPPSTVGKYAGPMRTDEPIA